MLLCNWWTVSYSDNVRLSAPEMNGIPETERFSFMSCTFSVNLECGYM
jgi:hypothetical protein